MLSEGAIESFAVVVAPAAAGGQRVRARLANGHEFVLCGTRAAGRVVAALAVGERVRVRFSPCDLSKGWMILESETKQ